MIRNRKLPHAALALALCAPALLVPAPRLLAADGVLEIHQACVATGCFPGDGPGFPVEITQDGSYLLTSNLQVPDENTTAISASAEHVSVDLGGFVISGVTVCSGNPIACSPLGSGRGIDLSINGVGAVRNGIVRGMGSAGISAGGGVLEGLVVESNGTSGISSANAIVRGNVVNGNGEAGILCGAGMAIDNQVTGNGRTGISGTVGPYVRGNRVRGNGGAAPGGAGIRTVDGMVIGNLVQFNDGVGLQADGTTVYGDNVFRSNNLPAGPQVAGGTQLGPNLCNNAPCP